ncbi:helix-turn-helix domain-containing protein [Sediminibacterium soli]|uniref:helix-turn-helix domain-containing protein n=1 Tax=Sediminibacterium soli TaxID=2698829 RepID=UPI00137B59CA|nr:XRE family transcriptional regulator [Sediminibacterium soli]NCI46282.1 helix-turn-helix transcriptional regulator [Sediminibacterium soli]
MKEDIIIQISNRIKNLRKEKNVTLQELSESAGVSKAMLSQVENSRAIPSLPVLLNLIRSLNIDFNDFFKDINLLPADNKVIHRKKSANTSFEKENAQGFYYQRLFSTVVEDSHVDFVLLRLTPDARRPMVSTDAWEFKYLISGSVTYYIGEETYEMEEGDSLFFDASEQHNPVNTGTEDALLLVVYFFKKRAV